MLIDPMAGKPATSDRLVDIPRLVTAYYTGKPDPSIPEQQVSFGTSGHRGSAFSNSFNEDHILAITQAISLYRAKQGIDGPLFLGFDTHALSAPAYATTKEVLAACGVQVMIAEGDECTPTPVISHANVTYNAGRKTGMADGIIITPSHNPPDNGGFKYNPPKGGPAGTSVTRWIESKANDLMRTGLRDVKRMPYDKSLKAGTSHRFDFLNRYINDLGNVIDMDIIRHSGINMGVDPFGGAGVHYWEPLVARYRLDLTVVNKKVDPTFGFMTLDWDGQIRMDPSSSYSMQRLIGIKDYFDISFACDTDHDRHGIVAKKQGLLPHNHYLSVAISYLLQNRPKWNRNAAVGKTVVSTQLIDRIVAKHGRKLYEVPVGFKWFADGLLDNSLCFGGEESAGATFLRSNGLVWTTDKDGFIPALLAAEITARHGKDPGMLYNEITAALGKPWYDRVHETASPAQKEELGKLSAVPLQQKEIAGENIIQILTATPGNNAPIGGIKVTTENGWFAARPSGTEDIYKIYAESFLNKEHLQHIVDEAQTIVDAILSQKERKL